ncbi:hypothetical protein SAMN06296386_101328 [Lachnospiraceae bacterium]|nr:hypothetical protein SAMN06296386_101328 [Lachnospiraceae bacterium]
MESENVVAAEFISTYGSDVRTLSVYIPYFVGKTGKDVAHAYDGKQGESKLKFPVFDSTLLDFVKKASVSKLMDRNYPYAYSRNRIRTHDDERRFIARATVRDINALRGFLSRYVLEGMHNGTRWSEGVQEEIFLRVLSKLREIMDFYQMQQ